MKIMHLVFGAVILIQTAVNACVLTWALIEVLKMTTRNLHAPFSPSTRKPKEKPRKVVKRPKPTRVTHMNGCYICNECHDLIGSYKSNHVLIDRCFKHCRRGNEGNAYYECLDIVYGHTSFG
ncbi:hypothetical protein CAPTEDRAFT_187819 [Capitella teleta]|uniref:Uncharacterized protein n=1 Tax=Capitella teleta TaxID=283909 RepID=R7VG11_CAPTE|nr:hypothetical protein CAPTEDRAFT_187819 [Capitella teleta]|eukprot:ELU17564.1 hypothetical protein CAPTEDRAFT_187819 [Capitella teleta]